MATDYDTPRKTDEELHEESLEELKARRAEAQSGQVDLDEEEAENVELPGADLSGEELSVRVVPKQDNEFTCSRCFLVHHITQLARGEELRQSVRIALKELISKNLSGFLELINQKVWDRAGLQSQFLVLFNPEAQRKISLRINPSSTVKQHIFFA